MNRPQRVFLVELDGVGPLSFFDLAWKDGDLLTTVHAGGLISHLNTSQVGTAAPPDEVSIVADIRRSVSHHHGANPRRAWDVTNWIGRHHPRIFRPELRDGRIGYPGEVTLTVETLRLQPAIRSSAAAAKILFDQLDDVLAVVEPARALLGTYGHRLRHLLLLACMDVESSWRSVLARNTPPPQPPPPGQPPPRPNTRNYVVLADAMRLREWTVALTNSIEQLQFSPFATWQVANPTTSLSWYDDYHATKHDREAHLDRATLEQVLNALAAVYIMLAAQFGPDAIEKIRSPFHVVNSPTWEPSQLYFDNPFDGAPQWQPALL